MRERTHDDLARCVETLAAVRRAHHYPVHWPAHPAEWLTPAAMTYAWVAVAGSEVIGHVALTGRPDSALGVERLFVHPDAGGIGAGTALLRRCVATADAEGRPIGLDVADNCHAAIRLYQRSGWRQVSTTSIDWGGGVATALLRYEPAGD